MLLEVSFYVIGVAVTDVPFGALSISPKECLKLDLV
jgi:hypothetical protein